MIANNCPATELMKRLRWGSTWRLLGFSIITYFVYMVYYARRQTIILNEYSPLEKQIGLVFFRWWFVITYISLALFFIYLFVPDDSPWVMISNLFDYLDSLLGLIWAFKARSSLNRLLLSEKGTSCWFNGIWTFVFQILYINFKINQLLKNEASDTGVPT